MEKITLQNGLTVSAAALGAMDFGTRIDEENAFATLDAYIDAGGNFIDTSNNYAWWWQGAEGGESERLLGKWLRTRGCRDRVVIATKVGFDFHGEGAGLRREQIEHWIDKSLLQLDTDYVDLYYAHTDDPNTPLDETMEAFHRLVEKGKVRALGCSNYDTWRAAEANMIADENGFTPYTVMQQRMTYLHPRFAFRPKYTFNESVNRERLRFLVSKNMPLVTYSCLCKGAYEDPSRLPDEYEDGERLTYIRDMAASKGVAPSALVIAYLASLHRLPGYPRVLPLFTATRAHLLENLRGLDLTLTDAELAEMEAVGR